MVPMTITKEYWALILMTLRLDSAGFQMVGSSSEQNQHLQMFYLSCCSLTKLNLYGKRMECNLTYKLRQKIQIYCCMYNLIPRASCFSDIGRRGLSIIGHLNTNSIPNKIDAMSVAQYVYISMLSETKSQTVLFHQLNFS